MRRKRTLKKQGETVEHEELEDGGLDLALTENPIFDDLAAKLKKATDAPAKPKSYWGGCRKFADANHR